LFLCISISDTTRKPRAGEQDGVNYHYIIREEFEKMKLEKKFIEWAEYSGNLYGTSYDAVKHVGDQGKICALDIGKIFCPFLFSFPGHFVINKRKKIRK